MKSCTTAEFCRLFANLPQPVQQQARAAYRQFQADPSYPSLRCKKVHPELPIYSARVSKSYRAVGQIDGDTVIWFWIGSQAEYDRLYGRYHRAA
ncbi:ParE family toxin-like protein [Halomicronema hongdechloris]|uniref:ParE family toxin-like protein n=1 Tax=Halomicronema hongdechloris TaxID=1209493 RepID=UPI000B4C6318